MDEYHEFSPLLMFVWFKETENNKIQTKAQREPKLQNIFVFSMLM